MARFCFFVLGMFMFAWANAQYLEYDSIQRKSKRYLLIPVVIRSIETGWGFGAGGTYFFRTSHQHDSVLRTSNVEALALYTERDQLVTALQFNVYFPGEKYILRWKNSFTRYYDTFWGFGNETPSAAGERYDFTQFFINPQFIRRVHRDFYVGLAYEMQRVYSLDYKAGGIFDQQNVQGREGGTVSGAGFILAWDSRDDAFYCTKGSYFQIMVLNFNSLLGSQFTYNNYVIDWRKFISLSKKDIIGFQGYGYLNSGNVPIRNMAILGGSDIMRGYYEGRYTDKNLAAFQAEYRRHLWKRVGVVAFLGYGEVFRNVVDLSFSGLKYSYGGGVRIALNEKEKLNLRIDYGWGQNSSGLYFTVRESF